MLDLEGLWTRYDDPTPLLEEVAGLDGPEATRRMQEIYAAPIRAELITERLHQVREAGVTVAGSLSPQRVIQRLGEMAGPEAVYVSGVGQHQMWAAQFIRYERPGSWINSGGLGTMGFAVPAAMGKLTKLSDVQADYLGLDVKGPYKSDIYRY